MNDNGLPWHTQHRIARPPVEEREGIICDVINEVMDYENGCGGAKISLIHILTQAHTSDMDWEQTTMDLFTELRMHRGEPTVVTLMTDWGFLDDSAAHLGPRCSRAQFQAQAMTGQVWVIEGGVLAILPDGAGLWLKMPDDSTTGEDRLPMIVRWSDVGYGQYRLVDDEFLRQAQTSPDNLVWKITNGTAGYE